MSGGGAGHRPKPSDGQAGPPNCGSGGGVPDGDRLDVAMRRAAMEDRLAQSRKAAKEEGVLNVPLHLCVFVSSCETKDSPSTGSGRTEGVLTDAPGDGPANEASNGNSSVDQLAPAALAAGDFGPAEIALIHALRDGSERVAVWPGEDRPVVLKGRRDEWRRPLDHLTGPEALALGLALVKAAMAVQP